MKAKQAMKKMLETVIVALFAILCSIVLIQIVCRFAHIQQTWIDETSKLIFVWLTYLGGAITVGRGMNITFDLIIESRKGQQFTVLFSLINICCIIFLGGLIVLGFQNAWSTRVSYLPMTHANMGIMNLAIPVGGIVMLIEQIEWFRRTLKARKELEKEC